MSHPFQKSLLLLATGQGRSGTTVLTKALGQHAQVYSNLVESNVFKDVLLAGRASSTMPSRVRQMVLSLEEHNLVFRNMLLNLLFPPGRWTDSSPPKAISTFSAMNPEAAEFAVQIFPRIHFVNIVRHGVEVVASRMVHRALGQHSFESHCRAWAASVDMVRWGQDRADFSLVRHEETLNDDTRKVLFAKVLEAAGLDHDPSVTDYFQKNKFNQTEYNSESSDDKTDLSKRLQRWQQWSDDQKAMFREICGSAMSYFGYRLPE